MACGKAVVASKLKGTTELFENSGAIFLVEPEKPDLLAKAIIELLYDTERTRLMGACGRQFVLNSFDRKGGCQMGFSGAAGPFNHHGAAAFGNSRKDSKEL